MTDGADRAADLFGLAGTFPRPGWVVLDAARSHRFTGELTFDLTPAVRVYLDRGEIYLAERSNEPPLGHRLIDAGALNAAELEHGSMQIGETAHLGRLFDRVPSIDRDFVLLMTEMMNDECVAWVATQDVAAATSTPYLHHPAGIHRWHRTGADADLAPGDPLPAPAPTSEPVDPAPPPAPPLEHDTLVAWGGPTTTTPTPTAPPTPGFAPPEVATPAAMAEPTPGDAERTDSILDSDWADRLETHGLPEIGSDPLAVPTPLPSVQTGPRDRFELIWPSGEIDEEFDAGAALDHLHERDHDRAGPTARVVRGAGGDVDEPLGEDPLELWDFETTAPSFGPAGDRAGTDESTVTDRPVDERIADERQLAVVTDDPVLSMRRTVESIGEASLGTSVGCLDDASTTTSTVRPDDLVLPGRVATRTESSVWSIRGFDNTTNRSVFDEATSLPSQPTAATPVLPAADADPVPTSAPEPTEPTEAPRVSALRRLIGGLRFR